MNKKNLISQEANSEITRLYRDEHVPSGEIAVRFGVSGSTMWRRLCKLNLTKGEVRSAEHRANLSKARRNPLAFTPELDEQIKQMHTAEKKSCPKIGLQLGCTADVIRRRLWKIGIQPITYYEGMKGRKHSDSARQKWREANLGRKRSQETCRRISEAKKGKSPHCSPESRRRRAETLRKLFLGKKLSEETKQKIRAKAIGRIASPETKQKLSVAGSGRKYTTEQRIRHSQRARRGPANHFWKGGLTAKNDAIRGSLEYRLWRTSVFERDRYTCRECETKSGKGHKVWLEAHHVKPFSLFPESRFDIENGLTLCRSCHEKTDTHGINARYYTESQCHQFSN